MPRLRAKMVLTRTLSKSFECSQVRGVLKGSLGGYVADAVSR